MARTQRFRNAKEHIRNSNRTSCCGGWLRCGEHGVVVSTCRSKFALAVFTLVFGTVRKGTSHPLHGPACHGLKLENLLLAPDIAATTASIASLLPDMTTFSLLINNPSHPLAETLPKRFKPLTHNPMPTIDIQQFKPGKEVSNHRQSLIRNVVTLRTPHYQRRSLVLMRLWVFERKIRHIRQSFRECA